MATKCCCRSPKGEVVVLGETYTEYLRKYWERRKAIRKAYDAMIEELDMGFWAVESLEDLGNFVNSAVDSLKAGPEDVETPHSMFPKFATAIDAAMTAAMEMARERPKDLEYGPTEQRAVAHALASVVAYAYPSEDEFTERAAGVPVPKWRTFEKEVAE